MFVIIAIEFIESFKKWEELFYGLLLLSSLHILNKRSRRTRKHDTKIKLGTKRLIYKIIRNFETSNLANPSIKWNFTNVRVIDEYWIFSGQLLWVEIHDYRCTLVHRLDPSPAYKFMLFCYL